MGDLMHESVLQWVGETLTAEDIAGRGVLEVGSYDVNGSVRPTILALRPSSYTGVDQSAGPSVDFVCDAVKLVEFFDPMSFDVVISTEMLEHVELPLDVIPEMVNVLALGGLLVITTRSPGFPYHPYPVDTWRYTLDGMQQILVAAGLVVRELVTDPQAPGVFATARKPHDWREPDWDYAFDGLTGITAMVAP
jgi:SAM-dependent methyltransferase